MEKYIRKDALVAEIEKLEKKNNESENVYDFGTEHTLKSILTFIDTLEVKEVDLDKEARHYLLYKHLSPLSEVMHQADLKAEMQYHKDIENAFKAGVELGMVVSNKEEKREEV